MKLLRKSSSSSSAALRCTRTLLIRISSGRKRPPTPSIAVSLTEDASQIARNHLPPYRLGVGIDKHLQPGADQLFHRRPCVIQPMPRIGILISSRADQRNVGVENSRKLLIIVQVRLDARSPASSRSRRSGLAAVPLRSLPTSCSPDPVQ